MYGPSGRDGVAEYLSTVAQGSMRCFQRSSAFDSAHCGQYLGCGYLGNRPAANPREDVALEAPDDAVTMVLGPN